MKTINNSYRILIVEDSLTQAERLRYLLDNNNYQVLVAKNGKEAIELLKQEDVSLVISDIIMPHMDGFELCKNIKNNTDTSTIPVILLTSLSNSEDVIKAIDSGADHFLSKPYNEDYLLNTLKSVLSNLHSDDHPTNKVEIEINIGGVKKIIHSDPKQMLSLLVSTYDAAIIKNDELLQSQNELKRINENLEDIVDERTKELKIAKERAEESDRLKSVFLATISHELRTPLNAIIGFSEILSEKEKDPETTDLSKIILKSGNHLLSIIEDLFDVTMIEAGVIKTHLEECSLSCIFEDVDHIIRTEQINLAKTDIEIKQDLHQNEDIIIHTDQGRLRQILINILKNALKFTFKGSIEYGCTLEEMNCKRMLQFYVKDTGIGIPFDKQEDIFDLFGQVEESSTRNFGGFGIGLSISKKLTELLGGKIWLESEEGKGSTFYFTIEIGELEKNKEEIHITNHSSKNLNGAKVLVVEDVYVNYQLLEFILSEESVETSWAKNGLESVNLLKEGNEYDLILMDINMDVMDGYRTIKEIRRLNSDIPIIAQTAYALDGDEEKIIKSGCVDYISKPIKKEELLDKVFKVLG